MHIVYENYQFYPKLSEKEGELTSLVTSLKTIENVLILLTELINDSI